MGDVSIRRLIEVMERNPRATIFFSSSIYTFTQIVYELGDDVETSSSFSKTIAMKNGCIILVTTNGDYMPIENSNVDVIIQRGLRADNIYIERFDEPFPFYTPLENNAAVPWQPEYDVEYTDEDIYVSNDIGHGWE